MHLLVIHYVDFVHLMPQKTSMIIVEKKMNEKVL